MHKYKVSLTSRAVQDLDDIYVNISKTLLVSETALKQIGKSKEILSLEEMPCNIPEQKTGAYANHGYRRFFVGIYTAIYRVDKEHKQVIVVIVRYTPNQF